MDIVSKYTALLGQQKLKESFVKDLELVLSRKNPNIEKGKLNFIRYSEMKNWSVRELFGEDLEQADRALINKVYHMLFDIGSDFESVIRMLYSFRNGPKSGIKVADPEDNYEWTNKDGNEKYSTKNLPKAHFITRMVEHNNGIALLFNRLDNKMFQDVVFPKAKGILFMKGRIKFHREDGTIGESPGCGSILVAFGEENAETLRSSNIEGRYIQVNQEPCNTHVDWEQRRYEIAKTILPITSVSGRGPHGELILEACDKAAELAVIYADALIKELK